MKLLLLPLIGFSLFANVFVEQTVQVTFDDNKHYYLSTIKENKINIDGKEHKVKAKISPYAIFHSDFLEFKFPTELNFAYDNTQEKDGIRIWSLNGDNLSIVINEYNTIYPESFLIKSIVENYKKLQAQITLKDITLPLSKTTLKGKRVIVKMGTYTIYQDVFVLYTKNKTYTFTIQDMIEENKHSIEYLKVLELLEKTLVIKGLKQN
jgi:hypothetical protein